MSDNIAQSNPVFWGLDWGHPGSDKSIMAEVEVLPDGTMKVLSFGELIEGELSTPAKGEADADKRSFGDNRKRL